MVSTVKHVMGLVSHEPLCHIAVDRVQAMSEAMQVPRCHPMANGRRNSGLSREERTGKWISRGQLPLRGNGTVPTKYVGWLWHMLARNGGHSSTPPSRRGILLSWLDRFPELI